MSATLSLTQEQAFTDLRAMLANFLPAGLEIIQAQTNKVPEPKADDFVLMTPRGLRRLSTNIDDYVDCAFVGRVNDTVLTVSEMILGKIEPVAPLFGKYCPDGSKILDQIDGTPGGVGTYTVSPTQQTPQSAIGQFVIGQSPIGLPAEGVIMAAGGAHLMQRINWGVQLDVHGPNSADNSVIIATLMRDLAAWDFMNALGHDVLPLYADEPRQLPFVNAEQQVENRWVIECGLQINPIVLIPQQFASVVNIVLISVDEHYPPS